MTLYCTSLFHHSFTSFATISYYKPNIDGKAQFRHRTFHEPNALKTVDNMVVFLELESLCMHADLDDFF